MKIPVRFARHLRTSPALKLSMPLWALGGSPDTEAHVSPSTYISRHDLNRDALPHAAMFALDDMEAPRDKQQRVPGTQ